MAAPGFLNKLAQFTKRGAMPWMQTGPDGAPARADELWRRVLGPDFEERFKQVAAPILENGVDPFGLDPDWAKYAIATAVFLHRFYFRSEVFGIERVPAGRVLLVSNHSGQIPLDGMMIEASMFLNANPPRIARSMVEKWSQTLPFVSMFFSKVGQVVGVPENARLLLNRGEALLVFPEGIRGISKPFADRYKLSEFGLGFMRLALETDTPVVPVAVIGAEEQYISFGNAERLAKALGMPALPLLPQVFVPGGQLPLPTKYRIYFGEPMLFSGDPDDDDSVIEEKVAEVRVSIQSMINRGLKERSSIFW